MEKCEKAEFFEKISVFLEVRVKIPLGGVAFFDSGVGGLTVLNACANRFSGEKFYYYGDNERAPYGNLPPTLIRRYTDEIFQSFSRLQVKGAVIACNTVTALCVDELRAKYSFPIIGAEPAVATAAKAGGEIFVLTTRATFNSPRFRALCANVAQNYPQARLTPYSCDGLAGGIEEHIADSFYDFTRFLPCGSPRAVVLGCTHYVYIKETIKNFYGCEVYDGNEGIARRLSTALKGDFYEQKLSKIERSRDGRPPFSKAVGESGICDHFLPPNQKIRIVKEKANKRSCIKIGKSLVISGVSSKNEFFFLGSGANKNKGFYERMFVF